MEIHSPSLITLPDFVLNVFPTTSISEHPTTQHLPQPRATSAACDVIPPLDVRIAWALCIPSTSSGDVSSRTRITISPRDAHSTASSDVNTTRPFAPPGPAGRPFAI